MDKRQSVTKEFILLMSVDDTFETTYLFFRAWPIENILLDIGKTISVIKYLSSEQNKTAKKNVQLQAKLSYKYRGEFPLSPWI